LALTLVSAIGVGVGQVFAEYLPRDLIRWIAGGAFIVMGILMLLKVL